MPKTLTLSEPRLKTDVSNVRSVKWWLLDENGDGYLISWTESAFDTSKPKCRAFLAEHFQGEIRKLGRREQAVSYNPDAALALRDVMKQLKKKYGYTYDTEVEIQLLPGEVVADD